MREYHERKLRRRFEDERENPKIFAGTMREGVSIDKDEELLEDRHTRIGIVMRVHCHMIVILLMHLQAVTITHNIVTRRIEATTEMTFRSPSWGTERSQFFRL